MARSATARRPASCRGGSLDRSAHRHVLITAGSADDSSRSLASDGPALSAPAVPEGTRTEVSAAGFWALLPTADRERLGLRLSRLVLKALSPLDVTEGAHGY
jgi:hypothetical protein